MALESVAGGQTAEGVVKVHTEIRDHPGRPQVVPFSFFNVRLGAPWRWKGRLMTFSVTPGVGVNSNNGPTTAEFFGGVSLAFGNFFVSAGAHVGHEIKPANGFQVGEKVPAELEEVPTETPWATKFAFGVSYRIPLK